MSLLGYTTFAYDQLMLSTETARPGDTITVKTTLNNTGTWADDDAKAYAVANVLVGVDGWNPVNPRPQT